MKIYIHIVSQGGKGAEEAAENRNYLAQRMTDEINEIIRVLQLTSYDEEQSDLDNLTVLKKLQNAIVNKVNTANDWLLVSNINPRICFYLFRSGPVETISCHLDIMK